MNKPTCCGKVVKVKLPDRTNDYHWMCCECGEILEVAEKALPNTQNRLQKELHI